jgi:hypothetical protein
MRRTIKRTSRSHKRKSKGWKSRKTHLGKRRRANKQKGGESQVRLFRISDEPKMLELLAFANRNKIRLYEDDATFTDVTLDNIKYRKQLIDPANGPQEEDILTESELYSLLFPYFMKIYAKLVNSPESPELLTFLFGLLREIVLYANPIWFDDLYYGFAALSQLPILSDYAKEGMDKLNNLFTSNYSNKRGVTFSLTPYLSRSNDKDLKNTKNTYLYDLGYTVLNKSEENILGVDSFLNSINYPMLPNTRNVPRETSLLISEVKKSVPPKDIASV